MSIAPCQFYLARWHVSSSQASSSKTVNERKSMLNEQHAWLRLTAHLIWTLRRKKNDSEDVGEIKEKNIIIFNAI